MKIAYFDLNLANFWEDYSISPLQYGGGRIFASAAKQYIPDFTIFSKKESFLNLTDSDKRKSCFIVSQEQLDKIMNGEKVSEIIPESKNYDIFMHHNSSISLNLNGCKTKNELVWPVGWNENINPNIKNLAFFDIVAQKPNFNRRKHNVYEVVIGPKIELFQEYKKEDFIFQCTRHNHLFQSIEVAKLCLKYNIPVIFAGPIEKGYPLLDYINNKTTVYLGEISQETKVTLNKVATYHTQFQNYPTAITLSAKESLSYGTAILALNYGNWPNFIKEGINGFLIKKEQDFKDSWEKRGQIKQIDCYNSILFSSEEKMVESFNKVFEQILK